MLQPLLVAASGRAGEKARNLLRLRRLGLPVPRTRVLTYAAAQRVARHDADAKAMITSVRRHLDVAAGVAVRSSADVEDATGRSFAGQFTTMLDVTSDAGVVDAVRRVVASASSPAATAYAAAGGSTSLSAGGGAGGATPDGTATRMGVIVQQMVRPVVSGVVFTIDPATGLHDVVVEAVAGRGDQLVQDGVTPQRWVVRGSSLRTAPDEEILEPAVVTEVVERARDTARRLGTPLDMEWVFDGRDVVWVQARPVTAVTDVPLYSRRIARDVLPGEVMPLVLDVNSAVVNPAWVDVLTSLVGDIDIDPRRMSRTFGYRAYFDMTAFRDVFTTLGLPPDALERLMGLPGLDAHGGMRPGAAALRHVPRASRQVVRWARTSSEEVTATLSRALGDPDPVLETLDDTALLDAVEHAMARARDIARLSIDVPLVHSAHEALLGRLVRRTHGEGARTVHLDLGRDDERLTHDPAAAVARLAGVLRQADPHAVAAVREHGWQALEQPGLAAVSAALDGVLETFGHLAERSNNVSLTTWAEDPDIPLGLAMTQVDDDTATTPRDVLDRDTILARSPAPARALVGRLCDRTAELRVLREQVSLGYGSVYMRIRPLLLTLGDRLVARGDLACRDDVFLLTLDELRHAVRGSDETGRDLRAQVADRRAEMSAARDLALPDVVIGDGFVPETKQRPVVTEVRGAAASAGRHTGRLRVLSTMTDGHRLAPGEVLAVETSDVTWTALFGRAGAVLAESGGLLSHAAVVARERGIPCVVSADGCTRLPDGADVEVDGYAGVVRVLA